MQYRRLSREFHPDKTDDPAAKGKLLEVQCAWRAVSAALDAVSKTGTADAAEDDDDEDAAARAAADAAAAKAFEAARRRAREVLEAARVEQAKARDEKRKAREDAILNGLRGSRKTHRDRLNLRMKAAKIFANEEKEERAQHPALSALKAGEDPLLVALRGGLSGTFSVALGDALADGRPAGAPLDRWGNTALHACAYYSALSEARIILSMLEGKDLDAALRARNADGKTALGLAAAGSAVHSELASITAERQPPRGASQSSAASCAAVVVASGAILTAWSVYGGGGGGGGVWDSIFKALSDAVWYLTVVVGVMFVFFALFVARRFMAFQDEQRMQREFEAIAATREGRQVLQHLMRQAAAEHMAAKREAGAATAAAQLQRMQAHAGQRALEYGRM
jgi:hypothetical protein